MAIKFSARQQPKAPAKPGKPAPAAAPKEPASDAAVGDADLFVAETAKPAARGRKKK